MLPALLSLCFISALTTALAVCDRGSCAEGWCSLGVGAQQRCFKVFSGALDFLSGCAACADNGGQLLTIHSLEEQNTVASSLADGHPEFFIGLHRLNEDAPWRWQDGSAPEYTNYGDVWGTGEHCKVFWRADEWRSTSCDDVLGFACETVTAPATCPNITASEVQRREQQGEPETPTRRQHLQQQQHPQQRQLGQAAAAGYGLSLGGPVESFAECDAVCEGEGKQRLTCLTDELYDSGAMDHILQQLGHEEAITLGYYDGSARDVAWALEGCTDGNATTPAMEDKWVSGEPNGVDEHCVSIFGRTTNWWDAWCCFPEWHQGRKRKHCACVDPTRWTQKPPSDMAPLPDIHCAPDPKSASVAVAVHPSFFLLYPFFVALA